MNWSEFISEIENGLFGERCSDLELANQIGTSREQIYKLKSGLIKNPQQATKRKFESGLGIKIDDRDSENITFEYIEAIETTKNKDESGNGIYVAELKVANTIPAGISEINEVFDEHTKEYRFDSNNHIYLKIDENNGDSLAPIVQPGDFVIIDLSNSNPRNNDVAAVKWKDHNGKIQYAVKIYNQIEGGILLTSTNINVPPKMVSHQQVLAKYKVIGIWKDN